MTLAAEFACHHADPAAIARLRRVLDSAAALPAGRVAESIARRDLEFHDALFLASRHRRLYKTWLAIRGQLVLFLLLPGHSAEGIEPWLADHARIVDQLADRDRAGLDRTIMDHVSQTYRRALANTDPTRPC